MLSNSSAAIERYKRELDRYTLEQLRYQSEPDVWSVGQMIVHVIGVADEYMGHMQTCADARYEEPGGKSETGEIVFLEKSWPDVRVKLDEPVNDTPNPRSKAELIDELDRVIRELNEWEARLPAVNPSGKVRHGWFGWLNAREWFELIDIHSRHHLRQQARLDEKLAEAERKGVKDE
ncbi:DinB family protein [Saccharibacillus sp. CPCC 101409]|uniref:DinB family protein n=1 Tax=Saccharibacillus sp. CPCC 101409 TaxID=3058041 RepID=UPI002673059C|nr:DinB family protein [Saccharibacillus sp. CPCC 101409]MDO3410576.1 DinB family protein [Saccharibacillus sp. CPCC 101409]